MDISSRSIHIFLLLSLNSSVLWCWFCQSWNIQPLLNFWSVSKTFFDSWQRSLEFQVSALKISSDIGIETVISFSFHGKSLMCSCNAAISLYQEKSDKITLAFYFVVMQLSKKTTLQQPLQFSVTLQKQFPNVSTRQNMK